MFFSLKLTTMKTIDAYYDLPENDNVVDTSKFAHSFAHPWLDALVKEDAYDVDQVSEPTVIKYLPASMRIERYYSSVKEDSASILRDAATLLQRQDWVGFFKACGPTFVKSVRRAQEVAAFFIFKSTNQEDAENFATNLQLSYWLDSLQGSTESKSLKIVIKGYGLGLTQGGYETLVATTIDEYHEAMKFAFKTMMATDPENRHIGMVYGMEVTPWTENTELLIESNLNEEVVEVVAPLSLISRSYLITDPTNFVYDHSNRENYRCKNHLDIIDKYGFCCKKDAMYDSATQSYDASILEERACRPILKLPTTVIRDNLIANGEFVARLDDAVREKLYYLSTLEMCISAVRAIPERFDFNILKPQDSVKYNNDVESEVTAFELKQALDPFNDYAMLLHMTREIDEFLIMYIQPCYAALFGSGVGNIPGTDNAYFLSQAWYNHAACTKLSCLAKGMRWDRGSESGGCVPGLMLGVDSEAIQNDVNCAMESNLETKSCKYSKDEINKFHEKVKMCWDTTVPRGSIYALMDQFCMPRVGEYSVDPLRVQALQRNSFFYCADGAIDNPVTSVKVNVALNKPAYQSTTYPHNGSTSLANLANDGNIDGNMWKLSVACTLSEISPWWYVELNGVHKIKEIVVYNRSDGGDTVTQRLMGFKAEIYRADAGDLPIWSSAEQVGVNGVVEYETKITVPKVISGSQENYVEGDKVRIILENKNTFLHMGEVQVWGVVESTDYSERFVIINQRTGKAISASACGGTGVAGTVELQTRNDSDDQIFKYNYNTKEVYHVKCQKALDIEDATCKHNGKVILWELQSNSNVQQWVFESDNILRNYGHCPNHAVAIKDESNNDGAEIVIEDKGTDWNQKFRIMYV